MKLKKQQPTKVDKERLKEAIKVKQQQIKQRETIQK